MAFLLTDDASLSLSLRVRLVIFVSLARREIRANMLIESRVHMKLSPTRAELSLLVVQREE